MYGIQLYFTSLPTGTGMCGDVGGMSPHFSSFQGDFRQGIGGFKRGNRRISGREQGDFKEVQKDLREDRVFQGWNG